MHFWDLSPTSVSGHSVKILGDQIASRFLTYLPSHFIEDTRLVPSLKVQKVVFVEAISNEPLAEAEWVDSLAPALASEGMTLGIVAYADLSAPNVSELLASYGNLKRLKGIRQIINHHPTDPTLTWPKVASEYLFSNEWKKNYALLAKHNFSFDLQLNPHQLNDAATFVSEHPGTTVILDHLACLHLVGKDAEADNQMLNTWRTGMTKMAALPNVYVKVSMIEFVSSGWATDKDKRQKVKELILETIALFGSHRCMFGSNFPVDKLTMSWDVVWNSFIEFIAHLEETAKNDLFFKTAEKVYRL